jgi:hypothetical protein
MARYLLAAEADQIQDFVFRASHLREVVGGSQLLSRFCKEGAVELLKKHGGDPAKDIIINDGGAFRVLFEDPDEAAVEKKAKDFGCDLAELYRRVAGGNLTVADPVLYDGSFQAASKQAQEKLRDAKSRGDVSATAVQLPYLAFCASCGVAISVKRHKRHREERENYYCESCLQKEKERDREVKKMREEGDTSGFLGLFYQAVVSACKTAHLQNLPEDFPQDTDDVAIFDLTGRRYVAYLLADGNGMGACFSACPDEEAMKKLSLGLPDILRVSLAAPCPDLLARIKPKNKKQILPVLPLILGGDDLFALLPAPWAIDFAARFCKEYEQRMKEKLQELSLLEGHKVPTVAAAVVICKANYPHRLAHKIGRDLLHEAKQLARGLEAHPDASKRARVSVSNFTLITGNEVGRPEKPESVRYHPTARPYFVRDDMDNRLKQVGIPIQWLLKHRLSLAKSRLPGKRRAEFERLYNQAIKDDDELKGEWKAAFDALLKRIERMGKGLRQACEEALSELGETQRKDDGYWRSFERPLGQGLNGHGLPDLLTIWNYAYDLEKDLSEYEE